MNQVPPRSSSPYNGQYRACEDAARLTEIFEDSERIALSSHSRATAEGRLHLAVECYHQLLFLLNDLDVPQDLETRMEQLVASFHRRWAEPALPAKSLCSEEQGESVLADSHSVPARVQDVDRSPSTARRLASTPEVGSGLPPLTADRATSPDRGATHPAPPVACVELEVEICRRVQLGMLVNGLPALNSILLVNGAARTLRDLSLRVRAEPDFADPVVTHFAELAPGARHRIDSVRFDLNAGFLDSLTERTPGRLIFDLESHKGPLAHEEIAVDLCAKNEWPGLQVYPELLASFVLPNEAFVQQLLRQAASFLGKWTGSPSLDGYQSRDPRRVLAIAAAVYAALQATEVSYANPPASFVEQGQRVRLPREIGEHRLATCLDIALLGAAGLEQAGLHPLVLVIEGHAFCGVWLQEESFPDPVVDDALRIRKRVELGEIAVFDPTAATSRPSIDFDEAQEEGRKWLADLDRFRTGIDVARARRGGVRPLPSHGERFDGSEIAAARIAAEPTAAPTTELLDELVELRATPSTKRAQPKAPGTRLEHWCRKLLDLSMRNRLLNFRMSKKTIPFLGSDLPQLEDALAGGRAFRIQPRPAELDVVHDEVAHSTDKDVTLLLKRELEQGRLRADLDDEELDKRLINVYRESRTAVEEGGSSSLFLAVGFLRFFETKGSGVARMAPVLLLPVELTRGSIQQGFRLSVGADEPRVNVTLLEMLARDHDIHIEGLDPLPEDHSGLDVPIIFHRIRERIRDEDRWELVEDVALGIFSFSKILLWKDLAERGDELLQNPIVRHLVERSTQIYRDGIDFPELSELDEQHSASETLCPLSADSSQLAAIFAAAKGKSFVLEGPPGTGKSQTIANLVAHCVAEGKSVLFVSEKMAALDVVHDRLQEVGLGEACLELHSNKAKKRAVLDQLRAALEANAPAGTRDWQDCAHELERLRGKLNSYVRALHRPRASGETPFDVLSRLIGLRDIMTFPLGWASIEGTTRERLTAARELVERVGALARANDVGGIHALSPIRRKDYTPKWDRQALSALGALAAKLEALTEVARPFRHRLLGGDYPLGSEKWSTLAQLADHLLKTPRLSRELLLQDAGGAAAAMRPWAELGRRCSVLAAELGKRYVGDLADLPLDDLDRLRKEAVTSWWFGAWSRRGRIRKALRSKAISPKQIDAQSAESDLARAIEYRDLCAEVDRSSPEAVQWLGNLWAGLDSDFDAIEQSLSWTARFQSLVRELEPEADQALSDLMGRSAAFVLDEASALAPGQSWHHALWTFRATWDDCRSTQEGLDQVLETSPDEAWSPVDGDDAVAHAQETVGRWQQNWGSILGWCRWQSVRQEAVNGGLAVVVDALESGKIQSADIAAVFEKAYAEDWYLTIASTDPELSDFYSPQHEQAIERFRQADAEFLELTRNVLRSRAHGGVESIENAPASSEAGILQRELTKKARHKAIRRLFGEIPSTLRKLKPCVLMSPLSVAQYLDPSHPAFDLVVFDEASQIPIWDAIGAIARGRQAVIVGDPKQLPPTSFFSRGDDGDPDEEDTEDMESILDECLASNLPAHRLRWHYRSRHESLIAFSNRQYYDNRLVTFPSCHEENLGVSWQYVPDGVFDRGRSRTNRREAEAVVAEIVRRLSNPSLCRFSIGVVTFNQAQQDLIQDLLEEVRRSHSELERFFSEKADEPVFVKNLENVQGDERDVILFSIGYGPDESGRIFMNFGPMNKTGGERRLNVAITRAKREVVVFSSLKSEQIDLSRTRQRGVRDLKLFLEYAEHGAAAFARETSLDPSGELDSPFEEQVARALRDAGWDVHGQVGCSGYRIDLAIVDPSARGRYVLGVECDGASYHSAKTARDRDRLRQLVLEGLGWRLHRIWSSDWWRDPGAEIRKVHDALEQAQLGPAEQEAVAVAAPNESAATSDAPADPAVRSESGEAVPEPTANPPGRSTSKRVDPTLAERVYAPVRLRGKGGDFYDVASTQSVGDALVRVVDSEGPITVDLAARRIAEQWGLERVRRKARQHILSIARARRLSTVDDAGVDVFWPAGADPAQYRDFRLPGESPESQRSIQEIPTWEFGNAACYLLERFGQMEKTELMRETARMFGFKSLGSRVEHRLATGIEHLLQSLRIEHVGAHVRCARRP